MSFSISLQCFENQTFSTFDRNIAWNVFGPKVYETKEGMELWYENGYNGTLFMDDDDLISGFSVNRPGRFAFDDVYTILRKTPSLLYWNDACAVANPAVISGMPPWMLNGLGQPSIVGSGQDIIACIQRS